MFIAGGLSIYEPGRLFGKKWPGVAVQGQEENRCDTLFRQVASLTTTNNYQRWLLPWLRK